MSQTSFILQLPPISAPNRTFWSMTTDPYYETPGQVLLMGLEPQLRVADFYYGSYFIWLGYRRLFGDDTCIGVPVIGYA